MTTTNFSPPLRVFVELDCPCVHTTLPVPKMQLIGIHKTPMLLVDPSYMLYHSVKNGLESFRDADIVLQIHCIERFAFVCSTVCSADRHDSVDVRGR